MNKYNSESLINPSISFIIIINRNKKTIAIIRRMDILLLCRTNINGVKKFNYVAESNMLLIIMKLQFSYTL